MRADGPADPRSWDLGAAAAYLDGRAEWWSTWPNAARDHGTFCVSLSHRRAVRPRPTLRFVVNWAKPTAAPPKTASSTTSSSA